MTGSRAPLVVLGCGQRCGSTLVQRLLCSHPGVMIWGEQDGQLRPLLQAVERLKFWAEHHGAVGRKELSAAGYQGFIANLTPESHHIAHAGRAFVETLFATPALARDKPVWGFKEVRYGLPEVRSLHRLFPAIRVVVIVRDPRGVLCSLADWERHPGWLRSDTETSLRYWRTVAGTFAAAEPEWRDVVHTVRYEDLVVEPQRCSAAIAEHCGLDAQQFDLTVFDVKVRNALGQGPPVAPLPTWSELDADMRALLDDKTASVAATYGYHPM